MAEAFQSLALRTPHERAISTPPCAQKAEQATLDPAPHDQDLVARSPPLDSSLGRAGRPADATGRPATAIVGLQ
jgi:hypothetical protein